MLAGLFLAMHIREPSKFMRSAINARREEGDKWGVREFIKKLDENGLIRHARRMAERYLNEGFSGENVTRSFPIAND